MLKKIFITFFVGLAYVVLAGHTIIPHHHDHDEYEIQHHSSGQSDHDEDHDPLSEAFNHFEHYDKKDITFLILGHSSTKKQAIDEVIFCTNNHLLASSYSRQTKQMFPEKPKIYGLTDYYTIPSLRAPPII